LLILNFGETENCLWAYFVERRDNRIVDRLNESANENSRSEGIKSRQDEEDVSGSTNKEGIRVWITLLSSRVILLTCD
jgi:hypothetical protein